MIYKRGGKARLGRSAPANLAKRGQKGVEALHPKTTVRKAAFFVVSARERSS
jgi:hypothetical protein